MLLINGVRVETFSRVQVTPIGTNPAIRIYNPGSSGLEYLQTNWSANVAILQVLASGAGTGRTFTLGNNRGSDYVSMNADGSLAFKTYNNGAITLTPNGTGLVGIGITPTTKLHIATTAASLNEVRLQTKGHNNMLAGYSETDAGAVSERGELIFYRADATTSKGLLGFSVNNGSAITEMIRLWDQGGLSVGSTYVTTDPGAASIITEGKVGVGVAAPAELLHVDDAIAVSNSAEGSTGRLTRRSARFITAALSGATVNIATQMPIGALFLGAQFCVNTGITGATSWSAALNTGSTTSLGSGYALVVNTKVNFTAAPEKLTALTDITLTAAGSNFTAGVIEGVVYYEELTSMANV